MRPARVVMLAPGPDFAPRIPQVPEPARIQTLVSQPPVKTLDMPILHWLAGLDVNRRDLAFRKPRQIMATGGFRTVVAPDSLWHAPLCHHRFQYARHPPARETGI